MDSSFLVRQRPPLHRSYAPRDPMPVRGVASTELDPSRTVHTPERKERDDRERESRDEHSAFASPATTVDPAAGELLQVQQEAVAGPLPDQALQRLRAYSRPQNAPASQPDGDTAADIEA